MSGLCLWSAADNLNIPPFQRGVKLEKCCQFSRCRRWGLWPNAKMANQRRNHFLSARIPVGNRQRLHQHQVQPLTCLKKRPKRYFELFSQENLASGQTCSIPPGLTGTSQLYQLLRPFRTSSLRIRRCRRPRKRVTFFSSFKSCRLQFRRDAENRRSKPRERRSRPPHQKLQKVQTIQLQFPRWHHFRRALLQVAENMSLSKSKRHNFGQNVRTREIVLKCFVKRF